MKTGIFSTFLIRADFLHLLCLIISFIFFTLLYYFLCKVVFAFFDSFARRLYRRHKDCKKPIFYSFSTRNYNRFRIIQLYKQILMTINQGFGRVASTPKYLFRLLVFSFYGNSQFSVGFQKFNAASLRTRHFSKKYSEAAELYLT